MGFFVRKKEALPYRLLDSADTLFLYVDTTGCVLRCNKKMEELTALKKNEIFGKYWLDILCRGDNITMKQQMLKAIYEDSVKYRRINNFEEMLVDAQNNERFICWEIAPVALDSFKQGEIDGVLFLGKDMTDLKEREAALNKMGETLKSILSGIKEYALYAINVDGYIIYYGMGSETMFGWHRDEIIFKHISVLHPGDEAKSRLPQILEQVMQAGRYESEIELVRKDNERFTVILTANRLLNPEGDLMGYIFIVKDITERKKLEYQVFQAKKMAAVGQFAASIAHEINNPLFVISGCAEMMLSQQNIPEGMKEDLITINSQTERIRKLIERLLKFSSHKPRELKAISINEVIESALPLLSYHKLPISRIEIERDLAKDIPLVKGDFDQLQEVFVNLFINACQAMPEGGRLVIKTSKLNEQFAEIKVKDTGQGIDSPNLKNLFMPFFSTKKDGVGLGLSICYDIIRHHSGSIEVETELNKGAAFIIKLPFA